MKKDDEVYHPICVAGYKKDGWLSDCIGDNISYLNEKINEFTALYWVWKNTDDKIVGLNHYRRYFCRNEILSVDNIISAEDIDDVLQEYDIILAEYHACGTHNIYNHIKVSVGEDCFSKGYMAVESAMRRHQPKFLDAFHHAMDMRYFFGFGMFITSRDILNEYCTWLFSFIIEAAEQIDVSKYNEYDKRIVGFFAERMMTVWLLEHNYKIKQLPRVVTE